MHSETSSPVSAVEVTDSGFTWEVVELGDDQLISADRLLDLLEGRIAAIRKPGAVALETCAEIVRRLEAYGMNQYLGMREALGTLFPYNHWTARYVDGDWEGYLSSVDEADGVKDQIFAPLGATPREIANAIIEPAVAHPIERLRCPKTGRPYHSVVVRAGAAKHHFDFGGYDLPMNLAPYVMRQMAWNLYLSAEGQGGELEVFRKVGTQPGVTKAEAESMGIPFFGNYDLPATSVEGVASARVPCRPGDFVLIMNRNIHRVCPVVPEELTGRRIAISSHIAEFIDGRLRDFN